MKIDFDKVKLRRSWFYVAIIVYLIMFSVITILKHESFHSTALDLGIYDQAVWDYSKGKISYNTVVGLYPLGDHVEPILFLIAPLYWLYSSPITLLITQTLLLSIAAFPIYWIAKKRLNDISALLISLAYLSYPSVHYVNLFDFHPVTLSIPFIAFSLYFLDKKRYRLTFFFLFFAAMCKEHLPLLFVTYGAYIFFFHKKRRIGVISALFGVLWTCLNIFAIIPAFSQGLGYYYTPTLTSIIQNNSAGYLLFIKELIIQKLPFMVLLLIPMGFGVFVVLSPIILLSVFQLIIVNVFLRSTSISAIVYQHQASLIPFIVIGTIYGIRNFGMWVKKRSSKIKISSKHSIFAACASSILVCSILANIFYGPFTIVYDIKSFNTQKEYVKAGHQLINIIPEEASVSTLSWVVPHLSHRKEIYLMRNTKLRTGLRPFPKELENRTPDYILLDLSETFKDLSRGGGNINGSEIGHALNNPDYGVIDKKDVWVLLKKEADYEKGICKIKEFLDNNKYPYLDINIENKDAIEKC